MKKNFHDIAVSLTESVELESDKQLSRIRSALKIEAERNPGELDVSSLALTGLTINTEALGNSEDNENETTDVDYLPLVARREMPLFLPIKTGIPVFRGKAMQIEKTLGPLTGPGGIEFWLDIFKRPLFKYEVWKADSVRPLFVLTSARLPASSLEASGYRVSLSEGTVWVLTSLIDNDAPDTAYTGFNVSDGSLKFENIPTVETADRKLIINHAIHAELKLNLKQPKAPEDSQCSAVNDVQTPDTIQIIWHHGNVTEIKIGSGEATFYQQKFLFSQYLKNYNYIAGLGVLLFEYQVKPSVWNGATLDSSLLELSETVDIDRAGWVVPVVNVGTANDLGEADGGYWMLQCAEGLQGNWIGSSGGSAVFDKTYLVIDDERFILACFQVDAPRAGISQSINLWRLTGQDDSRRVRFGMHYKENFPLVFICDSTQGDLLYLMGNSDVKLDRPFDINGQAIKFDSGIGMILLNAKAAMINFYAVALRKGLSFSGSQSLSTEPVSLALRNALLTTTAPAMVTVRGDLIADTFMDKGLLKIIYGVYSWQPILPDPYVANFACKKAGKKITHKTGKITGVTTTTVQWETPAHPLVRFDGVLGQPDNIKEKQATDFDSVGINHPECPVRPSSTQTAQGNISMIAKQAIDVRNQKQQALANLQKNLTRRLRENTQLIEGLNAVFKKNTSSFENEMLLLDVSTHQDLIGVRIRTNKANDNRLATRASFSAGTNAFFFIKGMDVIMPGRGVQVFALPQVQWEPVRTLPLDQDYVSLGYFPTPLASATDGGATVIATQSQTLVSMTPQIAVNSLVSDFQSGIPVAMMTTLPFGLKAAVILRTDSESGRDADSLEFTRPEFIDQGVKGGVQLTMRAESGAQHPNAQSAYFKGATAQLLNGVDIETGAALGISVLGGTNQPESTVESFFNNEFSPGGAIPRVPVTRFDISGYGGSNFSDWENPLGFAQATKVKFNVVVGRTALEVVKVASVLYPWGIKLTRSITIERRGGGGIIRRDSGWEATSPGIFDFRYADEDHPGTVHDSPYLFHPGLLRGLFNITRLRPAAGPIIKFTGTYGDVELAPQYFDADVKIEGLDVGENNSVFASGLLGFLQIKPVGKPLSPSDLKQLFKLQSAIGGPIDCMVNIANAGLRMRALRIEVDVADGGATAFVGVVRGMPAFRQSGAWSVIRQAGPGNPLPAQEARAVDDVQGLPVIRLRELAVPVGENMAFVPAAGPYRLADAGDLFKPDNPEFDYGFLQASSAHALLFKRLYIDAGTHELRSNLSPLFADVFARFTSKSLFPPKENAIELALNPLVLNVASGRFRLKNPVNMAAPRAPLDLSNGGLNRMRLVYDSASLFVDVQETGWSLDLQGLDIQADLFGMEKFSGTTYRVVGSDTERPQLRDITTHLHKDFEEVLAFIPGFANRGIFGPIDLNSTNGEFEIKIVTFVEKEVIVVPEPDNPQKCKVCLGFSFETNVGIEADPTTGMLEAYSGFEVGAELTAKIDAPPAPPVTFVILGLEFTVTYKKFFTGSASSEFELVAFVGYGAGKSFGSFEAEAYLAVGPVLVIEIEGGNSVVKFGGMVRMEATVDLKIVKIEIGAEFRGLFYDDQSPGGCGGMAIDYSGEVYIHVSILFFSISASYSISETDCL